MRIKAHFYEKYINGELKDTEEHSKETYGFKSNFNPPPSRHLVEFERLMFDMVKNITFRKFANKFQKEMKTDVEKIKKSEKVIVMADKTTNMYMLTKEQYEKLLLENVTKTYKKAGSEVVEKINREAKGIAEQLKLEDRINRLSENPAYITLKDHKTNFNTHPKCRLINPAKSEIGRISKIILERANNAIRSALMLLQWKDPQEVITWFDGLENKNKLNFIKFDVQEFYPSITEELLGKGRSSLDKNTLR